MTKVEELIGEELYGDMLAEGTTEEVFARIAKRIAAAREEENAEVMAGMLKDVIPHCADCIQAWSMGIKHTIDFSVLAPRETPTISNHEGPVSTCETTIDNAGYVEWTPSPTEKP